MCVCACVKPYMVLYQLGDEHHSIPPFPPIIYQLEKNSPDFASAIAKSVKRIKLYDFIIAFSYSPDFEHAYKMHIIPTYRPIVIDVHYACSNIPPLTKKV